MRKNDTFLANFKLEVFIKAPEVLFEFPLFAIGLDWLELAILLKSTSEMTQESYLKTHKRLQWIFFSIAGFIIFSMTADVVCNSFFLDPGTSLFDFADAYTTSIDCICSLITAIFSTVVLMLFIGAYISLINSLS